MFTPFHHALELRGDFFYSFHHVLAGSARFGVQCNNIDNHFVGLPVIVHVQHFQSGLLFFQSPDNVLLVGIVDQLGNGPQIFRRCFAREVATRRQDKARFSAHIEAFHCMFTTIVFASHQQNHGQFQVAAKTDPFFQGNFFDKIKRNVFVDGNIIGFTVTHGFDILLGMSANKK